MLRLLIAESARVPHLIAAWRRDIVLPYLQRQEQIVEQTLERGQIVRNALTENSPSSHIRRSRTQPWGSYSSGGR